MEARDIAMTVALLRGSILILTILAGCLSLCLGWSLYRDGVRALSRAEGSGNGFSFKIHTAAPGLFFALFGAALIIYAASKDVSVYVPSASAKTTAADGLDGIKSNVIRVQAAAQAASQPKGQAENPCKPGIQFRWATGQDKTADKGSVRQALSIGIRDMQSAATTLSTNSPEFELRAKGIRILTALKFEFED